MMKGIEILSQSEVGCGLAINWTSVIIVTTIAAIVFFISIIRLASPMDIEEWLATCATTLVWSAIVFLVATLIAVVVAKPATNETHYKVTISDEVSMNEFLEQYEIIDQEGKIYTIKEREE